MQFFNKEGQEISKQAWEEAIRDMSYVHIAINCYGDTSVRTSWLGIKTVFDDSACLFLTVTRKDDRDVMTKWHFAPTTVAGASDYHQSQCKEVGIPAFAAKVKKASA